ncbi:MAG: tetratricopeptide repeat protein [Gemmatimonadota bacterium]|nr:tetratricopeptide repeat protein [Gemmatimonadota bacterium]
MRSRSGAFSMAAAFLLAASVIHLNPADGAAQASDRSIVVAPLMVGEGVHNNFGKDVAKRVREAMEGFGAYTATEEGDIKDFLEQYDLDMDNLSPIEWRQTAAQMQAALVMVGTANAVPGGIEIAVSFFDPRTQDELPIETFTVADRKEDRVAAGVILEGLGEQVEYLQSIAFCAEYLASESVEDALRNCDRALEMNSQSDRARYLRGRTHMLTESWGAAVEDLELSVAADPSNTEALQSLAYTYAQLGDRQNSLRYYQEYLNFNPNDAAVRLQIAFELATAGGFTEAMQILEDGVQLDDTNADLWVYLGNVALSAGQEGGQVTDEAAIRRSVEAFGKVFDLKGNDVDASMLTNVVSANALIGEYDAALQFADRAIALINDPPPVAEGAEAPTISKEQMLAQVYNARASVYSEMEDYAAAASELEQALGYNPDISGGFQRVALYKLRAGDSDGAIADFRTAVQNGANSDEIANALFGQGYQDHFENGEYLPAIGLFEVASEFAESPDTAQQIHFFIAYGYYQRGTALDQGNEDAEACGPARAALGAFQNVGGHLGQAGGYQGGNQAQIREAVDVQLYRQEQIIEANCQR